MTASEDRGHEAMGPPASGVAAPVEWLREGEELVVLMILVEAPTGPGKRTDVERRKIGEKIQASTHRSKFRLELVTAATLDAFRSALMRYRPHVLHFSGHTDATGGLVFADDVVSVERFTRVVRALHDRLELVVFNVENSLALAGSVAEVVRHVVGMDDRLEIRAGIRFSEVFYEAIAEKRTVATAFELAIGELSDSDQEHVPRISPFHPGARNGRRRRPDRTGEPPSWARRCCSWRRRRRAR